MIAAGTLLRRFLREPLVHFLLLGAMLFAFDAWWRPGGAGDKTGKIVVDEGRVRNLSQNFQRSWQRPPTPPELEGLIETHVREEVMTREARALGLDRDDTIIRRRLQQKMEFIAEEAAALVKPTDAELDKYLKEHPQAFRVAPRASFAQIYLDPAKRQARLKQDAQRLLDQLNQAISKLDPQKAGDSMRLLEARYVNESATEIARLFGEEFADTLLKQAPGTWVGPIESGYGAHLVRLESLKPGGIAPLAEVRPQVEREWANARRQDLLRTYYDKLRTKYTVEVRMPQAGRP